MDVEGVVLGFMLVNAEIQVRLDKKFVGVGNEPVCLQ